MLKIRVTFTRLIKDFILTQKHFVCWHSVL